MVRKLMQPGAPSATSLAKEVGITQATLSRWIRKHGTMVAMEKGKRSSDWTPEEKLRAIVETAHLTDEELGSYLREKGLHAANLEEWRKQSLLGMTEAALGGRRKKDPNAQRIKELERELLRKDKALAEASALLILKKKVEAIWGVEDDK
jgi:transposase